MHVVVVGASAAGLTTIESLRRSGFDGSLTLIGEETRIPYDRPPLSKGVLAGTKEATALTLRPADRYVDLDVDLRLGTRATALDPNTRTVTLAPRTPASEAATDGPAGREELRFDNLVIATGVRPRTLPYPAELPIHTLRTAEDAIAIRDAARNARQILIIGASFLGTEIAASLSRGPGQVTVVDPASGPMITAFGPTVSAAVTRLHAEHGVHIRAAVGVAGAEPHRDGVRVRFTDGSTMISDVVIAAVGAEPAVDWLHGSGITLTNGVDGDATCRAAPGIYAAGDVASWLDGAGIRRRVEHRTNATEQAIAVSRSILGQPDPYDPLPYVWTDQYDDRLQAFGWVRGDAPQALVSGSIADRRFVLAVGDGDRVIGVIGCNAGRDLIGARSLITERIGWRDIATQGVLAESASGRR